MSKLPQVTIAFWIMKIAATTLGETGGDLLAQTLNLGYLASSLLFLAILALSLAGQLRASRFHPALFWTVIIATSTAGTTMSDFLNRTLGLGYPTGAALLTTALLAVFVVWKSTGLTFDVAHIGAGRGEILYWTAILLSNTLGTSVGDFLADSTGLGFGGGAAVIAAVMIALVAAYRWGVAPTFLFWTAFVLTRPLGATVGDLFSKPVAKGGLGLGTVAASAVLAAILVALVARSHRRRPVLAR